ncbi:MAG TPA: holo-ACP synthase [Anaeromyxobacter sp.]|nr:holo-ACP synthase [Anaeromyxobacter sp.]
MILGLGLDLVDIARMARILEGPPARAERFVARVFTAGERAYCDARVDRATRYAARFAAKEAALKALGVPAGLRFQELEVVRGEGAPALVLSGAAEEAARRLGVARLHLSITHDGGTAAAVVVAEGTP